MAEDRIGGEVVRRRGRGKIGNRDVRGVVELTGVLQVELQHRQMLERARSMLILETSVAKAVSEAGAIALIARALGKCDLPMPMAL